MSIEKRDETEYIPPEQTAPQERGTAATYNIDFQQVTDTVAELKRSFEQQDLRAFNFPNLEIGPAWRGTGFRESNRAGQSWCSAR